MGTPFSFTSASSDLSNYTRLGIPTAGRVGAVPGEGSPANVARISRALGNAASQTPSLELALVGKDGSAKVRWLATGASPTGSPRAGSDGASGNYFYEFTFQLDGSNSSKVDLLIDLEPGDYWAIGCTDLSTLTSLTGVVEWSEAI